MKALNRFVAAVTSTLLCSSLAVAASMHYGATLPFVLVSKDPPSVHNYRAVFWFQPDSLTWGNINLYFAGNVGYWWTHSPGTQNITIYAFAPVMRYYFTKTAHFSPYLEASVGPAYMNRTRFGNRNLGMHYTFQDEIGAGAMFGSDHGAYVSLSALHYSNGRMSAHNSGITVPLLLNVGYQFN